MSVAAAATQLGASTVLIEKARMGGDCLNYGCVPSKSLLAAAHAAHTVRGGARLGVCASEPVIDDAKVLGHVRDSIAALAPNDSVERFEGLGARVIQATGRFIAPDVVEADGTRIRARRFVIATGSRAAVPDIPGLDRVPFLTNESLFDRGSLPRHLIIIGGGPIGCEMGQAHRRLGALVTILDRGAILPRDDPELVDVVRARLLGEGIDLRETVTIIRVEPTADGVAVVLAGSEHGETRIMGSHLLVATGRQANVDDLGLETAGIAYERGGIQVDARLRTTNRKVFALGDVVGGDRFTHVASHHAGVVIKNALFHLPARADRVAIPRVTYTDPELAGVGLNERQARERHGAIRVLRWPFAENDRARTEAITEGLIKVICSPRGRVLGVGIAGPHAGELLVPWSLCLARSIPIAAMAQLVVPYPTLGEVGKRAAASFFTNGAFVRKARWIARFLSRFG